MENFQTLKLILLVFGVLLGLRINLNKSIVFGINMSQSNLQVGFDAWMYSLFLAFNVPRSSFKGESEIIIIWDLMIDSLSRRLDGWKKAFLSPGSRITLIHFCLSHISSYFLSLFRISTSLASRIEKMQGDFLWSRYGEGKKGSFN